MSGARHSPANDPAGKRVDDEGHVDEALPRRQWSRKRVSASPGHRGQLPAPGSHRTWRAVCFAAPRSRTTLFDRWFTALCCYSFQVRFHGQSSSSLCIEGCLLPLHGAHVAPERVTCRRPLPPVNGSPVLRVLSTGLTSARSLDRPRLGGLSGPTGLRLNRTDLPCSRQVLRLHASGTNPGSVPTHSPYRGIEMQPSP